MENLKIVFESENLIYVKLSESLIEDYLKMVNDKAVASMISHKEKTYTYEGEKAWVEEKLSNNNACYSMIEKATNEFVGNIELMYIENSTAEIGISITSEKQNKHYGTEAMKAIIKYGTEALNIENFHLFVFDNNFRAIHCYEKVGFVDDKTGTNGDLHMVYKRK